MKTIGFAVVESRAEQRNIF